MSEMPTTALQTLLLLTLFLPLFHRKGGIDRKEMSSFGRE